MGANLTIFENNTGAELQLRFFRPPARPDHFRRIIRIRAGARANIPHSDLRYNDTNPERHEVIMIFVDGVGAGVGLVPRDVINCSRVICGRNEDGGLGVWMLGRRRFRGPRIRSGTGAQWRFHLLRVLLGVLATCSICFVNSVCPCQLCLYR
ncbi:hypothetical protein Pint_12719 [Pistacia integerrima]|uniref:Uncharacterized protein n=1 Tax=Pistacia integerrima TaxID=434235 RepID=A0ACC0YCE2_9ROSI|nr:hypothetical protein Pint_12719 [Pistacia integerrima]